MNFKITKLEIENFRSIQDKVTLNLKSGLFSIEGINYTETNSTNGCGKSTLISALFWAFTGSSLTNEVLADEVVNLKTNKNCRVSVYVETEKDEIRITRVRKDVDKGNNLFLEINGQDLSCHKVADTQDRINKLIKIPFDLLKNTIIMTSNMSSAFSSLTPQQRINTLERIRDYSIWERVRDEANRDIKLYNTEISNNNSEINTIEGSISVYNKMVNSTNEKRNSLIFSFDKNKIESDISLLKKVSQDIENKILLKQTEIDNFDKSVFDDSDIKNQMLKLVEDSNQLKLQIKDIKNKAEWEVKELQYSISSIDRDISVINKWFTDDTCPTCGRKLDRTQIEIDSKTAELTDLKNKKSDLESQVELKSKNLANNVAEMEINRVIENNRKSYSELQLRLEHEQQLEREKNQNYTSLNNQLSELKQKLNTNNSEIDRLNSSLNNYDSQLVGFDTDIDSYSKEIERLNDNKIDLEKTNKELEAKKSLSDFYYKLLGAKGELRPYLLSKDIAYLNNKMQCYINRFFKNTEVTLLLNNAAIDIKIQADGVTKSISSLSGGEKKRVDISIQLALYDLIQTVSQSKFNLLCLDEIESQLDPIGCEQLIEIIEDKSENIETVWWITNAPQVKENIPRKILVKKILGKTEVEEI